MAGQPHQRARHAVSVATALTAPISAIASADLAASARTRTFAPQREDHRQQHPRRHIIGSVSDEIAPIVVSTRGDSANAIAAITREVVLPMPSASATRKTPEPDDEQQCPPQPLRHPPGKPEDVAGEEEGAVREQVAVAWFCACPNGNSLFHRLNARARNRSGSR